MKRIALVVMFSLLLTCCWSTYNNQDAGGNSELPTRMLPTAKDININFITEGSYYGEEREDQARGLNAGDVNGDGYDDILFRLFRLNEPGITYLVYGKPNPWDLNVSLSDADSSFIGINSTDEIGRSVSGGGDINNDGFDDFIITSKGHSNRKGKICIFFGKSERWGKNVPISESDASFIGEEEYDWAGSSSMDMMGDVNGDGFDDILIGAAGNCQGGYRTGKVYIIFGKENGWLDGINLSNADASFLGENIEDSIGYNSRGVGDINGDGFDDFVIGSRNNDQGETDAGKVYLFFGKEDGWIKNISVSEADASFIGGIVEGRAGACPSNGDIDGDGFDDFLIGVQRYDAPEGRVYLILGKSNGWQANVPLNDTDGSFVRETGGNLVYRGRIVQDMDEDGFDDIILDDSGFDNEYENAGKVYFIKGRYSGYGMNTSVSLAITTIVGSVLDEHILISDEGDFNNDGIRDILIRSLNTNESHLRNGKTNIVFGFGNPTDPLEVYNIKTYLDKNYSIENHRFDILDYVYVELQGLDGNSSSRDYTYINISSTVVNPIPFRFFLRETDFNSGLYRGVLRIPPASSYFEKYLISFHKDKKENTTFEIDYPFRPSNIFDISVFLDGDNSIVCECADHSDIVHFRIRGMDSNPRLRDKAFVNLISERNNSYWKLIVLQETDANSGIYTKTFTIPDWFEYLDNITATSVKDPSKKFTFIIHTPILLWPYVDITSIFEDDDYRIKYSNIGYNEASWQFSFDATWLQLDEEKYVLYGTPNNNHIGKWDVYIEIDDGKGHSDYHDFKIRVINTPPKILTENVIEVYEDEEYYVDYSSSDDGQGQTSWELITNAGWLSINEETGELTGTPMDDDRGFWNVRIIVDDGNGGTNSTSFELEVINVNKPPRITNTDISSGKQSERYYRDYEVHDTDKGDTHTWELITDAEFLQINEDDGILMGTPLQKDVGTWLVNVTVIDSGGLIDSHVFDLTIEDVNDKPTWIDIPKSTEIRHGKKFYFDVNATDPDVVSSLEYSIRSNPESDISIDPETGRIEWVASIDWFEKEPYDLDVTVRASDGEVFIIHSFIISVIPSVPPIVDFIGPIDGGRTPSRNTVLEWECSDPENDTATFDIYLHENQASVVGRREEALYLEGYENKTYNVNDLVFGKTYYWSILPFDGCSYGICTGGIRSFILNNPPKINEIPNQKISSGSQIKVRISTSDADDQDLLNLVHSLIDSPEGMNIDSITGTITWNPSSDQIGWHTITVGGNDGIETTEATFEIQVTKGDENKFPTMLAIIISGIVGLIAILVLAFLFIRRRESPEGIPEEEKAVEEKEERAVPNVPISVAEAHAHDKDSQKPSYEELYGKRVPEDEKEGMTAKELKEYIHDKVEELESSKK